MQNGVSGSPAKVDTMKKTTLSGEQGLDDLFEKFRQAPGSFVFVPLADACRKMGRLDEALEICEKGVARNPSYASGHVVKGKCLYDRGDFDTACETFERVLDLDDNNLFFRVRNRTLISRIIEGKFPNYEAVIPKGNPDALEISREKVTGAIRRVSLLSSERSKGIRFNIEPKQISLYSSNPEIGEARDKVEVDYSGNEMEIGFNSQYLLDFLTTIKSEKICFELKDENSAVLMKPTTDDDIKYLYVLMPMKI